MLVVKIFVIVQVVFLFLYISLIEVRTFGTSMLPVIKPNQILLFSRLLPSNLTGKIVIFKSIEYGEASVTHRAIMDDGIHVQTKGDNNNVADDVVLREQVLGVYLCKLPMRLFIMSLITISFFALTMAVSLNRKTVTNGGNELG